MTTSGIGSLAKSAWASGARGRRGRGFSLLYKDQPQEGDTANLAWNDWLFGAPVGGSAFGTADATISLTGTATAQALVNGAGSGLVDLFGSSAGSVLVNGTAAGTIDLNAAASGAILVSGTAAGTIGFSVSATGTTPLLVLYRGDDAPDWRKRFYDKNIKEFEDSLEEIVKADDPQEAAQEAIEAFQPLEAESPIIRENLQAISEALRGMTMRSLRRKELQAEIADIRAELARVAEYRRKRRNNEAALLLLL